MTGTISGHVADYLAMRRGMGYRMDRQARSLRSFAADLDRRGHRGPVPLEVTLDWAIASTSPDTCNPARRLSSVRGFLRYLAVLDAATGVPAVGLLGPTTRRTPPHVHSDTEIADLMAATATLRPAGGLRPHCYRTLFGLLACTGLRISEALALQCADVDLSSAVLTVQAGKGGRSRLVPLHPTAVAPLRDYDIDRVDRFGPTLAQASFFRTDTSEHVSYEGAFGTFARLRRELGWTAQGRTTIACRRSWWSTRISRPRRCRNSSPTPKLIRARSTMDRVALARSPM